MRQILQNLNNGAIAVEEVPAPQPTAGALLIRTTHSLVSAGTERMLLEFGSAGWLGKMRQQPEKARAVWEKVRTDGVAATLDAVRAKLDQPVALGYCNAGVVLEAGPGVSGFPPGTRVVSNGAHAEVVRVPANLCARIPPGLQEESAVFTVMGAIALQGVRLAQPTLGETFAVFGLGLIGLLTVQILRCQGCQVLAIDPNSERVEMACRLGARPGNLADTVDGALLAAATSSSQPAHLAAQMCRKRGRIVLVGVTGLELSRDDFYKKELTFQVSCSYGPGRYDPAYEEQGRDYPAGYVRWTAQRNFEAVLGLMAEGKLEPAPLITHRFPFYEANKAYKLLRSGEPHLGILLAYPSRPRAELLARTVPTPSVLPTREACAPAVAVIGAGNYAFKTLLPALQECGIERRVIASSRGVSGAHAARKFGFAEATSDLDALFARPDVDAVVIATRHDSHARFVCQALAAGKHVFVEKPLARNEQELEAIETATQAARGLLMVGFNRRFAPHIVKAAQLLQRIAQPRAIVITVNAGPVPPEHWTQDAQAGGGRIVGEACHFLDLARFLAGAPMEEMETTKINTDTLTASLRYQNGSAASIHYFANGSRKFPKERVEIFCGGSILQLNNFRVMKGFGWPGFRSLRLWRQDKGNAACVAAFMEAIRHGGPAPIAAAELFEVTRTALQVASQ
jgi:predicted dehydrogenase/threonine dehydrogenase-like Zn-dependent dehydrogenase